MINKSLFSSNSDEWYTPIDFFKNCSDEVGGFDLDPCSDGKNAKCDKFYTRDDDGLTKDWYGNVFCNPPYSDIAKWSEKCSIEIKRNKVYTIYFLIPARTDTRYFHEFLYKKEGVELRFIKGRLKFGESKNSAPFPSLLAIFTKGPL